jgi:starch-binding outer membrane protein, SusD/RagB family
MKKLNLYQKSMVVMALLIFGASCKELEEKPLNFLDPKQYYNSSDQIESVFTYTMANMYTTWAAYGYGHGTFVHDDQLNGGNLVITADFGRGFWNLHYANINNLNKAIGAMKGGSLGTTPTATQTQLMAQAKFLRAFNYFMLVRLWGDVPLLTEATDPKAAITRAPIAEVYKLIVADFTEAIAGLPVSWPASQNGRMTRDAAKGLLAKVYLTMATFPLNDPTNYAKAAAMAKEVIDAKTYSLVPDINNVFSTATKYGPEMMWSFNANDIDRSTDPKIWTQIQGYGDFTADITWVETKYPEQPRKAAYIELTDPTGKSYKDLAKRPGVRKFLYGANIAAVTNSSNIPIIRYADVLLIFAEAENMSKGGPTQAAVDAINQVINRANGYVANAADPLATTSMTKEAFDKKVIDERSWELCFEYDRWFDLIRKRILKEESIPSIQPNFTTDDYLFPIPQNDRTLNPGLTQNPGY